MEQCSTVTEAVTSVVEETSFETQCAMVSDRLVQLKNKKLDLKRYLNADRHGILNKADQKA